MNGRTIFGVIAALLLVALAVGLGMAAYNAGVSAGLDEAARNATASGAPAVAGYPYGYAPYWHGPWGFGFFGIIFWIFGILLFVGLLRAIFGWGRWGGPGRRGWSGPGSRRESVEEWHRELHRGDAAGQPHGQ